MKPEITNKPTQTINYSTAFLVFLLAAGSFILSYSNLYETGLSLGLSPKLAWIWPLLVDFALIVFSLAVVRASLHNEQTWWPWLLVGVYTAGTVGFNVYHAPANLAAQIVAIVAPVSLFLSFETLMGMLKSGVRRSGLVQSIAQITAELAKLEGLYRERQDNLEAELKTLGGERLAEIEAQATLKQAEVEALTIQEATLQAEVDRASQRLSDISQQVEEKQRELNATQDETLVNLWDLIAHVDKTHLDTQTRQFFVALLTNAKVPQRDIAAWAGVTIKTIQRDVQSCNGLIKKAG
jgi:Trp operon repressor